MPVPMPAVPSMCFSPRRRAVPHWWSAGILSLLGTAMLAGCGGGSQSSAQASETGQQLAQAGRVASEAAAVVTTLTPVADRRIGNSVVHEVTYRVSVSVGPVAQAGLSLSVAHAVPGTTVIDGDVEVGDVAAGATVQAADTITLRHATVLRFDPAGLTWKTKGTPVHRVVTFDPARCRTQPGAPYAQTVGITGTNVMVASADVNASAAGCRVLARGGTAADAAVAVQAVLGVVEPFASGLGGGSVVTYYDAATRQVRAYDGLSSAPANIGGTSTVPITSIYQMAVPSDLQCRSGQSLGGSLSAQQGNVNISGRATGVPGTVAVLDLLHQRHGRTAWGGLWEEAIDLAEGGFPMTKYMYSTLYSDGTVFDEETGAALNAGGVKAWWNTARDRWGAVRCRYKDIQARYCDPNDSFSEKPLPVGSVITNAPLAQTMRLVRDGGAAAFYDPAGPIATAVLQRFQADKVRADGSNNCTSLLPSTYNVATGTTSAPITPARIPSLMAAADFGAYRAVERRPLVGQRFGMTIHTQPAPLFGGVVALYSLGLLERLDLRSQPWGSEAFYYRVAEASRLANADRRNIVGDPAYSNVNERVAALLAPGYLDARAAPVNGTALGSVGAGTPADGIPPFVATDPAGYDPLAAAAAPLPITRLAKASRRALREEDWNTTSSLAIVDGYGNALAMTTTINTHWGAHIEAAGMMLNNALSNFSAGTPGIDVNGYAANKRPRSSIAPSIALDADGRVRLAWGAAGGGPIPDYIVKTFLGHAVYGMELQAAINADNWTGQGLGSSIAEFESGKPVAGLIDGMRSRYGYTTTTLRDTGLVSGLAGIAVDYDVFGFPTFHGAADPRRAGAGNGY